MKKTVAHFKKTKTAFAPDMICKCINRYSKNYRAVLILPKERESDLKENAICLFDDLIPVEYVDVKIRKPDYDLIHFHNHFYDVTVPKLIQYHSPYSYVDITFKGFKTVISQYQATLPKYKDYKIVRNIIDIYADEYLENIVSDKIRIGYSPSCLTSPIGAEEDKGYEKTIEILKSITEKYNVEVDIITGVPLEECIKRKRECNILIDEVVTKSFHRSGLEGLALGKLTICSLGDDVAEIMRKASGSKIIPFENIWIENLETFLDITIMEGIDKIIKKGEDNRIWVERHWNPITIVQDFELIYQNL